MIRFIGIDVIVVVGVVVLAYLAYRSYMNGKKGIELHKVVFSGGPLNNAAMELHKVTHLYKYTYDKPKLVNSDDKGNVEYVPNINEALYEHMGDGLYEYQGSVNLTEDLDFDEEDEV